MENFREYKKGVIKYLFIGILLIINMACSTLDVSKEGTAPKDGGIETIKEEIKVVESYENRVPDSVPFVRKYHGNLPSRLNYGLIMAQPANLREEPTTKSKIIESVKFYSKVELLERVEFQGSEWYKVRTPNDNVGYIYNPALVVRRFRFDKGVEKIGEVEKFIEEARNSGEKLALVTAYTPDSRVLNKHRDKYGRYKVQSAAGYYNGEELYIPDRSIVKILKNDGATQEIKVQSMSEPYLKVNSGEVTIADRLNNPINKAIVVDIDNQNFVMYEKINGRWSVISYSYSKTGYESKLGFETPRGSFIADIGKDKMLYTNGDGRIEGYAYHATRFSGGGYLHGTPVTLEESGNERDVMRNRETFLGTFPGTRKCIRTPTEHSYFIHSWIFNRENNLPVYEKIRDNILFVIY